MDYHSLFQGIFLTQGLNPGLLQADCLPVEPPGDLLLLRVPLPDLQVFSKISVHVMAHNDFNFLFSSLDIYLQMLGHCFSLLDKKLMFFSFVKSVLKKCQMEIEMLFELFPCLGCWD